MVGAAPTGGTLGGVVWDADDACVGEVVEAFPSEELLELLAVPGSAAAVGVGATGGVEFPGEGSGSWVGSALVGAGSVKSASDSTSRS